MKTLKNILLICGLLTLLVALITPDVNAQTLVFTNRVSMTNTLAAATTTTANMGNPIDLQYHRDCALLFRFTGNGAGTGLVTLTLARSYDGTTNTLETIPRFTWSVAQNGTTQVIAYTNLDTTVIGAARYLHVISGANTNATVGMTNVQLDVITKQRTSN